ncbi:AmmeMemoRadiSam system radical SAM enzyme [bacterium CG_4_9_14_3_um_filter_65_15]|nr:MAG: AmmeMemoRadiSam system radical SAM enzyme [bacterium CG_4_9_14_3_um_filter_65_15]
MTVAAAYWRPLPNGQVACDLCPVGCRLRPGRDGPCASRTNRSGSMALMSYGRIVAAAVDPIEKKPLYHFHPGRDILSVAAPGCNLHCLFCQNFSISQDKDARTREAAPQDLVAAAVRAGSVGIAFTYSEPLVWFEFVRDTARLARSAGLKNVLVTNGYLNPEPLVELLPLIDAANIDLKSMDDRFYRRICRARLEPVLDAIGRFHAAGVHLELTNLLIPGHNDSDEQITRLVDFVADLDDSIPLHFSAYHPAWRMQAPATPLATLRRALTLACERLPWVYLGNAALDEGRDTVCRNCGEILIARSGFAATVRLRDGTACPACGYMAPVTVA